MCDGDGDDFGLHCDESARLAQMQNTMRIKVAFLIYLVLDINGGDALECLQGLKTGLSITDPDWIDCHRFFWLDANEDILKKVV